MFFIEMEKWRAGRLQYWLIFAEITDQMQKNSFKYTLNWSESAILFAGFIMAQFIIGIMMALMIFVFKADYNSSSWFQLFTYTFAFGIPILAFDFLVTRPKGIKLNFNFSSSSASTFVQVFLMMLGMMLISEFITALLPTEGYIWGELYQSFLEQMNALAIDPFALVLMVAVLAPVLEEILFRGIIMKALLNRGLHPYRSILISAFIFGLMHIYPWQFLGAFLIGLVLGLVYYKTKSLLLPILMHAFNNFIAAMLMIFVKEDSLSAWLHIDEIYLFGIGIVLFSISLYLFLMKHKSPEGKLF